MHLLSWVLFTQTVVAASKKMYRESWREKTTQSDAQSYLVRHLKVDQQLRERVFPRMRADQLSLVAKKDTLICAFGARYLKTHRDKHFINVTSRKMREVAKVLIQIKKLKPEIKSLFQALQPQYFDSFVAATKIAARYDEEKDYFESPTFALNISNSLKQCCDIAIVYALKKQSFYANVQSAEAEANLKTMIHLFTTNWRYDISSQAANDLNIQKWNKITIVPLATDLKLLKDYITKVANNAASKLAVCSNNVCAYRRLMETIFCRVLLLNRKRPGELQRLPLHVYEKVQNEKDNHYEEFDNVLSITE